LARKIPRLYKIRLPIWGQAPLNFYKQIKKYLGSGIIKSEIAKLNNFHPYNYFKYILTELPKHCDEKENIDTAKLDDRMPWSDALPEECRKPRR
jgi:hypothetical protein